MKNTNLRCLTKSILEDRGMSLKFSFIFDFNSMSENELSNIKSSGTVEYSVSPVFIR